MGPLEAAEPGIQEYGLEARIRKRREGKWEGEERAVKGRE